MSPDYLGMSKLDNLDYILFAVEQAKEAEEYGFTRNDCSRNLKTALHQYWQNKEKGQHSTSQRKNLPRSVEADKRELKGLRLEHVVPQMWFVDKFMDMDPIDKEEIRKLLETYFNVLLVTKEEDAKLTDAGLRSDMPVDWDKKDPWARHKKVGIEIATKA